jgi:A/G-specific adenine glycosylase
LNPKPRTIDHKLQTRLLAWFDEEKRQLPWRGTRDPYRIWISEVMLQQTTVNAVLPRYRAFLARFPDLATLARAREQSVLAAWSGLGYYARARNLHRAAREVLRRHRGRLPSDPEALRSLPGFGEYIASAVASLAFGRRIPAAEANVTRVLSRVFAIPGTVGSFEHRGAVLRRAATVLDRRRPGDVTAALMDLGQLVCRPLRPDCPRCPIAAMCIAGRRGLTDRFPHRAESPAIAKVFVAAACPIRDDRALLMRRSGRLLQGLWQFPSAEGASPAVAARALRRELAAIGLRLDSERRPAVTQHTIVHRRLEISVYRAASDREPAAEIRNGQSFRWFTARQLGAAAIPTLTRKIALASGFLPRPDRRILFEDESRHVPPRAGSHRRGGFGPGPDSAQGRERL